MTGSLDLYRVFLAAAELNSISAAAKQLFVTQPAVSSAIMSLETLLEIKLFKRENRGIKLTPEGAVMYEYVRTALIYIKAGEDKLRDIHMLSGGVLRVGASDMTLRFFLLDYLERFTSSYPSVRLSVTNAPTPRIMEAIRSEQIDFGVVSGPFGEGEDIDVKSIPVRKIRDVIIASNKYDAGKDGIPVKAELLAPYPLIMLEKGTATRRYLDGLLPLSMRSPDIELATFDLVLDFARRGIGIACIVEDFAKSDLNKGALHEIRLTEPFPSRELYLVYNIKYPLSTAAKKIIDMVLKK